MSDAPSPAPAVRRPREPLLAVRPPLALALLLASLVTPPALALLAGRQRAVGVARQQATAPIGRVLPWPDLALATGARHLRFVSLEEPGAAFSDGPATLDAEPAGGAIAPPRAVWVEMAR